MHFIRTVHAEPAELSHADTYRVNIWEIAEDGALLLDAFVLFEVKEVVEVLEWARDEAGGRPYEVFVETSPQAETEFSLPRSAALLRVAGSDPTEPDEPSASITAESL